MGEVIDPTMLFLNLDNHVVIDKIVEEVLERKAECILCMDDAVCSRVLKKLREKHVKVPKDIRVASFITAPYWKIMCRPLHHFLLMRKNLAWLHVKRYWM
jgi:DNA-binding LacI/PurR family transcriptional regulator